jgi:hypothetical protein
LRSSRRHRRKCPGNSNASPAIRSPDEALLGRVSRPRPDACGIGIAGKTVTFARADAAVVRSTVATFRTVEAAQHVLVGSLARVKQCGPPGDTRGALAAAVTPLPQLADQQFSAAVLTRRPPLHMIYIAFVRKGRTVGVVEYWQPGASRGGFLRFIRLARAQVHRLG